MIDTRGRRLLAELAGCDPAILRDPARIRALPLEAADVAGVTSIADHVHTSFGEGVTGFAMLVESHISIDIWPMADFAAVDVYTCGDRAIPSHLADGLGATRPRIRTIHRGAT